jgi:hypothetical protein
MKRSSAEKIIDLGGVRLRSFSFVMLGLVPRIHCAAGSGTR